MDYKVIEEITPSNYGKHIEKEVENAPKQYNELKKKYPDACLLLRIGDFYEAYCEDAQTCHEILGITLTTMRGQKPYRIVGFPHYALDTYLPALIRAGKRVAICDKKIRKTKENN